MNDKITVLGLKSKIETAKKKIPTLKSRQVALKVDQGLYLFVTAASCTWYVRTDSKKKKKQAGDISWHFFISCQTESRATSGCMEGD